MTRLEFNDWIETHYEGLVREAFERTHRGGKRYLFDTGQADAADAVQSAIARALDSGTFALLEPHKTWPWMVDAVRSVIEHGRRASKRAYVTHGKWAGAFLGARGERGYKYAPLSPGQTKENFRKRDLGRIVAVDPDQNDDENGHDFIGPRGWRGEYSIAHIGKCPCGGECWSRIEIGRDVERQGYSKRWTIEALMAIKHAVRATPKGDTKRLAGYALGCVAKDAAVRHVPRKLQVLGCSNGHRTYTGEVR